MTTYLVAGDGDMPKRELHRTLTNLAEGDDNFGLALLTREETALDLKVVDYGVELEEWPVDEIPKILEEFDGDSPAALLAVFVNPRDEDPADEYLNDLIGLFNDAGFSSYSLNDGMAELDITAADERVAFEPAEPESEEELSEVAAVTVAAVEDADDTSPYTREELEAMKIRELRALASALGLEISSRVKEDFVSTILAAQGDMVVPAVSVSADEPTVYDHDEPVAPMPEFDEVIKAYETVEAYEGETLGMNGTAMAVIHLRDRFVAISLTREQVEHLIEVGEVL